MDFFNISTKEVKGGVVEVSPDFTVGRSKDLMVRGQSFYAIWDAEKKLWSTDEYDVQRLVDQLIYEYAEKLKATGITCKVKPLRSFNTNGWKQFRAFMKNVSDNSHQLDMKLTFANTETKKSDYVSRRLPYDLAPGPTSSWDEILSTLYDEGEREKIEWAIGAIISGDSKTIEKFLVFYGPGGTGKSTIMKIIQKLFVGYIAMFEAKALVGNNNSFATAVFKSNPLVAIQHDGDLSKIEDNSTLNSIVGHDEMLINEKYKPGYEAKINAFLFMGTNKPVKITDAKSGIIRRLIDVKPSGRKIEPNRYHALMAQIDFELGGIANHCLEVYRKLGKNYYNLYQPLEMMFQTDVFFNYVSANYDLFEEQDSTTHKQAFALYKEYAAESGLEFKLPSHKFREELKNYFEEFFDRTIVDGIQTRSYYAGFKKERFGTPVYVDDVKEFALTLEETTSRFDEEFSTQPAQYGNAEENPIKYWTDDERIIDGVLKKPRKDQIVNTVLSDVDTSKLHFVRLPSNHIVIDFDLTDEQGKKSLEKNLVAANAWPLTYAEISKSGAGVHLHYIYDGDPSELARVYSDGIEIKVFNGNASLRRRLTLCNNAEVETLRGGLPFKENKSMQHPTTIENAQFLRTMIAKNLRKEFQPSTKSSIDFINHLLNKAYNQGLAYDLTDLEPDIMTFACDSTNQAVACMRIVNNMKFKSEGEVTSDKLVRPRDERLIFYDVEVYPNLFVVCWKYEGSPTVVRMINPSPQEVEELFQFKLVGFYNRRYDNHIIYAAMMGYTNEELYELSQKIISGARDALFAEAYNISWTDIYDYSSKKQSLKKFEIELGLHHMEMDLPWDEPVPKELWNKVVEYCVNDVLATEATHVARKSDYEARLILAELSGLTPNDTTQKHAAKIVFGNNRNPQSDFIYTDLSVMFPGYKFDKFASTDKSTYRGEVVGEGGYVYAEPGMYENVALLDIASMHPTSIRELCAFGEEYTPKFWALVEARLAIKHGDYAAAREMLGGKLKPYLEGMGDDGKEALVGAPDAIDGLSSSLKIAVNIVYGLTSAKFENQFRDPRNIDNIVAKRGALHMIDLKHAVQEKGFQVVHIKTDSIKIPNATPEIIEFVKNFGKKYGYTFEHEATYEKFCLVNDAVYIAKKTKKGLLDGPRVEWTAVGAQFQHPYVYKSLFTGEQITFDDLCEAKEVKQGSMYLDFDQVTHPMFSYEGRIFVGKTGLFVPVMEEVGGGVLLRVKDGKDYAVAGTKGYHWVEAEVLEDNRGDAIDMKYFERLAREARKTIQGFGDFDEFVG